MKLFKIAACILCASMFVGCTMANGPVAAAITMDLKGPVGGVDNGADATKVGKAKAEGIIFVGMGDASIATAAKNGGITDIHHVDSETTNILGIYSRYVTVVYGE